MIKLNSLCLLICLNVLPAYSVVSAEADFPFTPFIEVVGGYSRALDSAIDLSENSGVYGIASGMEIYKNVDLKAQYQDYSKIDVDSKSLSVKTKFFNYELSYRYPVGHDVSVVAGLGIGYWKMTKYQGSGKIKANGVAPITRVGFNYDINKNISVSLSYQYVNAIGDLFTGEYDAHNMLFGARYSFGGRDEITPPAERGVDEEFFVEEQSTTVASAVVPMKFCNKIITPIIFNFDESVLSANNRAELRAVVQYANANNFNSVTLVGYTDDKGSESYNLSLAKRRIDAVENFFENEGLAVYYGIANGKDHTIFKSEHTKRRVDVYVNTLLEKETACDQKFGF